MIDDPEIPLWARRQRVEETQRLHADSAETHDGDVTGWGCATPGRIAMALRRCGANPEKPVLDYGCGSGLSGMALKGAGFARIDGTDPSPQMLAQAEARGVYQHLWQGEPGDMGHVTRGAYPILVATGAVSLGAAPPETLDLLIDVLPAGGFLAFSFNEATLAERGYTDRLDIAVLAPDIELVFEENGPHLPGKGMTSTVYVLTRT